MRLDEHRHRRLSYACITFEGQRKVQVSFRICVCSAALHACMGCRMITVSSADSLHDIFAPRHCLAGKYLCCCSPYRLPVSLSKRVCACTSVRFAHTPCADQDQSISVFAGMCVHVCTASDAKSVLLFTLWASCLARLLSLMPCTPPAPRLPPE